MATLVETKSVSKTVLAPAPSDIVDEDVKVSINKEVIEDDTFQEIEKLQDLGVNASDVSKLKQAGYCTVLSVLQSTRKDLISLKGFSDSKVDKILEAATKVESTQFNFVSASDLLQRRSSILHITTGSLSLDRLLGGGIESMAITELFGENRTGKTQICHTLCVTGQLPLEMNGGNGKVCFIDTEGTFRPEKIGRISERFGLQPNAVLDNILYARAHTHEHLMQLICLAAAKMVEDCFSLMIIDSIMALFRVDFSGRGELAERQQVLGKTLNKLQKVAEQFNISIVYTNHVMSDPSGAMTMVANPSKPIGGHVLGHASTHRLSLRIGRGDQRICKIYDSPCLPSGDAIFQVSDTGVIDPTE